MRDYYETLMGPEMPRNAARSVPPLVPAAQIPKASPAFIGATLTTVPALCLGIASGIPIVAIPCGWALGSLIGTALGVCVAVGDRR